MRKKKHLAERVAGCGVLLAGDPEGKKSGWAEGYDALHVEIGCGKGQFIREMAELNPGIKFVALERVPEALVMAMEKVAASGLKNVEFICADAAGVENYFGGGEISRLYINFCDPWPSRRKAPRRLTHRDFLEKYRKVLSPEGAVAFKTDNADLFEFSLIEFENCGFSLKDVTRDLHGTPNGGVKTEYEQKFFGLGVPICRLEAVMT